MVFVEERMDALICIAKTGVGVTVLVTVMTDEDALYISIGVGSPASILKLVPNVLKKAFIFGSPVASARRYILKVSGLSGFFSDGNCKVSPIVKLCILTHLGCPGLGVLFKGT